MNYPKPTDTLEGFTNIDNYGSYEIWKKETKRALVDVLNGEMKIHLFYDLSTNKQKTCQLEQK